MDDRNPQADELPDDCLVVRGGFMRNKALKISAATHYDEYDEWAWSFWACPGKTADEIAAVADFDNDHIRESTIGRLREAGFEVVPDSDDDDHATVRLDGEPDDATCKRLRDAFDEARPIGD